MIVSVFLTFKKILFALSQLDKFFKSVLKSLFSFLMELVTNKRLVSSENWWTLQNVIALCKSFIYSRNRRGPRTDPCGTPYAIEEREEL